MEEDAKVLCIGDAMIGEGEGVMFYLSSILKDRHRTANRMNVEGAEKARSINIGDAKEG